MNNYKLNARRKSNEQQNKQDIHTVLFLCAQRDSEKQCAKETENGTPEERKSEQEISDRLKISLWTENLVHETT